MARKQTILGAATAVALAGVLAIPTAANAADGDLYTWVHNPTGSDQAGFATISPTDAALSFLGTNLLAGEGAFTAVGAEVCDGIGYAVDDGGLDVGEETVITWDTATGAILSGPVDLFFAGGDIENIVEADTLADCTLLSLVQVYTDQVLIWTVSEINVVTGEVTPLVYLDWDPVDTTPTGIATDPAGTTYVFGWYSAATEDTFVLTADLASGTTSSPEFVEGLRDAFGDNFTHGIDFDSSGALWAFVGVYADEQYHLVSFPAGADLATAVPADHGLVVDHGEGDFFRVTYPAPLAAEGAVPPPAPQPQLAATGAEVPLLPVLAAGILLLGGAALVLRRRPAR